MPLFDPQLVPTGKAWLIDTLDLAKATNIPAVIDVIQTGGFSDYGDGGGAEYRRVGAGPANAYTWQDNTGAWWKLCSPYVNVKMFGAVMDGVADDYPAIAAGIEYVEDQMSLTNIGGVLYFPVGECLISEQVNLPNRVALKGANGRATIISPMAGFSDDYMFYANNGGISMFGSRIDDFYIDARGFDLLAVVYSTAWQETCGMNCVTIQYDGQTQTGFKYTDGHGGASFLALSQMEFFSNSAHVDSCCIDIAQVSLVGAFIFTLSQSSMVGSDTATPGNNLVKYGIRSAGNTISLNDVHFEHAEVCVSVDGQGSLTVDTLSGGPEVQQIIQLEANYLGGYSLTTINPNSLIGTGNIVNDLRPVNLDIEKADYSVLPNMTGMFSCVVATTANDQNNVTGDNTEYTVLFDTEVADYLGEYNPATGEFIPKAPGKYLFTVSVEINLPAGSTNSIFRLNQQGGATYELFRGNQAQARDTGNNATVNGAFIIPCARGQRVSMGVLVGGIGAKTVDVLAAGTKLSVMYLGR